MHVRKLICTNLCSSIGKHLVDTFFCAQSSTPLHCRCSLILVLLNYYFLFLYLVFHDFSTSSTYRISCTRFSIILHIHISWKSWNAMKYSWKIGENCSAKLWLESNCTAEQLGRAWSRQKSIKKKKERRVEWNWDQRSVSLQYSWAKLEADWNVSERPKVKGKNWNFGHIYSKSWISQY